MSILSDQLLQLQQKLQQLIKNHSQLKKENVQLKKELAKVQKELIEKDTLIDNFKQQLDILKLSKGAHSEAEKKELEKKLNAYVKEIDKCLALLHS